MTWDEIKTTYETRDDVESHQKITASDWNAMVADQKDRAFKRENFVLVESADDLPEPSEGVIELDADTTYQLNGTIEVNDEIHFDEDVAFVGENWGIDGFHYTGTGTALTAVIPENVFIRNIFVSAPNGTALDFTGNENSHLVTESLRIQNVEAVGRIDGFNIPVFSMFNVNSFGDGLRFDGVSTLIGFTTSVFQNPTSETASVIIEEEKRTDFIYFTQVFFRGSEEHTSTGISVENGLQVEEFGIVSNCVFDDNIDQPTAGFGHDTVGWDFSSNLGIADSDIIGEMFFSGNEVWTEINEQNEWVLIEPEPDGGRLERMVVSNGLLTYEGVIDVTVHATVSIAAEVESNNVDVEFGLFKNGALVPTTTKEKTFRFGDETETIVLNTFVEFKTDETLDVRVRCIDDTEDILVRSMSMTVN